jgi:phosphoribosyl 1,2-cyclic phosphate phosphodiesterase
MTMKVTVLGCGNSAGVPMIGCTCKVCTSDNPKNNRTRVSVFVEVGGLRLLIDSSPDLRQQALRNGISRVDAVLYTHEHADHAHGIDDLRSFNYMSDEPLPVYSNAETIKALQQRFNYAFLPKDAIWFRPSLIPHVLPDASPGEFGINDISISYFDQLHGKFKTLGYRIGKFSYSTDVDILPEEALKALEGTEVWIVDCLRYKKSYSHSSLENTLHWIKRIKPKLAVLTHMSHEFDYDTLVKELPSGVVPGYDGMIVEL